MRESKDIGHASGSSPGSSTNVVFPAVSLDNNSLDTGSKLQILDKQKYLDDNNYGGDDFHNVLNEFDGITNSINNTFSGFSHLARPFCFFH